MSDVREYIGLEEILSLDAIRLAGKLKDRLGPVGIDRIYKLCDTRYSDAPVEEIIEELVRVDFLRASPCFVNSWVRNHLVVYTTEMSRHLMAQVQKLKRRRTPLATDVAINIVRDDVSDAIAYWFGYCKHPVFLRGQTIHYLEDDE